VLPHAFVVLFLITADSDSLGGAGVGHNFAKLSEKKDLKKLVPKLRLKHRYVSEPNSERPVTSREYGAFSVEPNLTPKPPSYNRGSQGGSQTDRPFLPKLKIPKGKPDSGYAPASIINSQYWKQHAPGHLPSSPRKTQRTSASDGDIAFSPRAAAKPPTTTRPLVGLANVPQGYTGYKPRFRYAHVDTDVQLGIE